MKYKWKEWFSQPRFTLRMGTDYHIGNGAMVQQIRNKATQLKMKVHVKDHITSIEVVVIDNLPDISKPKPTSKSHKASRRM